MVRKKSKKITKKKQASMARTAKRKSLAEWSRQVRDRDGKCIVCERTDHLNAHHIIPKESFKQYMFETTNGITVCPSCHKFGKYSCHKHPIWFAEFLRKNRPEQWKWAVEHL